MHMSCPSGDLLESPALLSGLPHRCLTSWGAAQPPTTATPLPTGWRCTWRRPSSARELGRLGRAAVAHNGLQGGSREATVLGHMAPLGALQCCLPRLARSGPSLVPVWPQPAEPDPAVRPLPLARHRQQLAVCHPPPRPDPGAGNDGTGAAGPHGGGCGPAAGPAALLPPSARWACRTVGGGCGQLKHR